MDINIFSLSRIVVVSVMIILFHPLLAYSKTFYVDSSAGSNANSGDSVSNAWRSPDVLKEYHFSEGDRLLFKRGSVWRGYVLDFYQRGLFIGAYGSLDKKDPLPLFSSASSIKYENVYNSDLDIYLIDSSNRKHISFPGWQVSGDVRVSRDTADDNGVCARLVSSKSRLVTRLSHVTSEKLASNMPVKYLYLSKIVSGVLNVKIKNLTSGRYLSSNKEWVSEPVYVSITSTKASSNSSADWVDNKLSFINDSLGQLKIEFIVEGDAMIDNMKISTEWKSIDKDIIARTLLTKNDNAVYSVFDGSVRLNRAASLDGLGKINKWYWDATEKMLYLYANGVDYDSLNVDRSHNKLLTLNGEYQVVDSVAFEAAQQGINVKASNVEIKNSVIRSMSIYSIRLSPKIKNPRLNNIKIYNNKIYDSGNGPYLIRTDNSVISYNHIYNIGDRGYKADQEAIPVMTGSHNIIEHNDIVNVSIGIDVWAGKISSKGNNESRNNVIRYNRIKKANKYGLVLGGEASLVMESSKNLKFLCEDDVFKRCYFRGNVYGNMVNNNLIYESGFDYPEGAGIRVTKTPYKSINHIYNNTLYNNKYHVSGEVKAGGFNLVNNIFLNPWLGHLRFEGDDLRQGNLNSCRLQNNIYYSSDNKKTKKLFIWAGKSYSNFATFSNDLGVLSRNELSVDPNLTFPERDEFYLKPDSPAIARGIAYPESYYNESNSSVVTSSLNAPSSQKRNGLTNIGAFGQAGMINDFKP